MVRDVSYKSIYIYIYIHIYMYNFNLPLGRCYYILYDGNSRNKSRYLIIYMCKHVLFRYDNPNVLKFA